MNDKMEINETEVVIEKTEGKIEEKTVDSPENAEAREEITTQEEFISEFAPAPIKIPNYNKEKEKKKVQKAHAKQKKQKSKKARRRRRIIRKILTVTRAVVFSVLLFVIVAATVSSLLVKLSTTEYSVETAIRNGAPETFTVGKVMYPETIGLEPSSSKASMADILRDNSLILVTYDDIKMAVDRSSYPSFVANAAYNVINYYLYGTPFEAVSKESISKNLYENASYIKIITGTELGESRCDEIAGYIANSTAVKEISAANLNKQPAVRYTEITSVLFSSLALIVFVIALLLLLVLTVIYCKDYWHKIIGTAVIIAGLAVGLAGFFFKPAFSSVSPFINSVVSAITANFSHNAIIYASVTVLVGILVVLIGNSLGEDDDDEYYEEAHEVQSVE